MDYHNDARSNYGTVDHHHHLPHGRTEERLATAEEVAQREADIAAAEAQRVAEEEAEAARAAARASAEAKLVALGLTSDEIAAIL